MNKRYLFGIFRPLYIPSRQNIPSRQKRSDFQAQPFRPVLNPEATLTQRRDIRLAKGIKISRAASFRYARVTFLVFLDLLFLTIIYKLIGQFYSFESHPLFQPFDLQALGFGLQELGLPGHSLLVQIVGFQLFFVIAQGAYRSQGFATDFSQLSRAMLFSGLAIAFMADVSAMMPQGPLLPWLVSGGTFLALLMSRACLRLVLYQFRRHGYFRLSAFVVSEPDNSKALLSNVKNEDCYYIVGAAASSFLDWDTRGESIRRLNSLGVDELIIDWNSLRNRRYVLRSLKLAGVKVRVFFMDDSAPFKELYPKQVMDSGFLALKPNFFVDLDFRVKRIADFICSAMFLLILSPLYLLLALAIRIDSPGNVFYRQTRIGLHGRPIQVWKFRSMVSNAEKLQQNLEKLNENSDGILFKMKDDPRITKVGKFIRRYSLDELPQLFNVLVGEMSLIGPRPLPVRDVQRFSKPYFFVRHDILPGITGLWQVSGRSDINNFEEAVSLDLEYIENWSLGLDLEILFRTFGVILKKSGAY